MRTDKPPETPNPVKASAGRADPLVMDMYDLVQRQQIKSARFEARRATAELDHQRRTARQDRDEIHDRVEHLTLVCEAMWALLRDRTGMTDADLDRMIDDLDLADGRRDRKRTATPTRCECGSAIPVGSDQCLFCERPVDRRPIFDRI